MQGKLPSELMLPTCNGTQFDQKPLPYLSPKLVVGDGFASLRIFWHACLYPMAASIGTKPILPLPHGWVGSSLY
jgi:hypothetical protein